MVAMGRGPDLFPRRRLPFPDEGVAWLLHALRSETLTPKWLVPMQVRNACTVFGRQAADARHGSRSRNVPRDGWPHT